MRRIAPEQDLPAAMVPPTIFTLGDLVGAVLRHKLIILLLMVLGGTGAWFVASRLKDHYSAGASLISDVSMSGIVDPDRGGTPQLIDPSATTTIVETIGTTVVLARAVDGFSPEVRARLIADGRIRETIAKMPDAAAGAALEKPLLVQYLADNLDIANSGRSYVIHIFFKSGDPDVAAAVANGVANAYLDYRAQLRRDAYQRTLGDLAQEIATLRTDLSAADQKAQALREEGRLLAARSESLTGARQEAAITETSELFARQREMERTADAAAAVYEQLLRKQRELQSRLAAPENMVQLFAPAVRPLKPSGFNVKPVLLVLGVAGGFFLGAAIALLLERRRAARAVR